MINNNQNNQNNQKLILALNKHAITITKESII